LREHLCSVDGYRCELGEGAEHDIGERQRIRKVGRKKRKALARS
jgi:hypothetical protein